MYDAVVCVDHVVCLYVFVHVVDWSGYSANAFFGSRIVGIMSYGCC